MNHLAEITFGYADLGDITLHYAAAGTGDKLVILLHGFPEFWYSWRYQLGALGREYTVVAPDMRGYNLSGKPSGRSAYRVGSVADDICRLIKHFDRDTAAVIGHDWGASVAWTLAKTRPDVLWKLGALQVPPAHVWKRNQTAAQLFASWYMFFFQLPWLPELILRRGDYRKLEGALRNAISRDVITDADIAQYKKAWRQPGALTAMLNYYRANIAGRLLKKSEPPEKIAVSTLFIYAEKDEAILPQTVEGVGEAVSGPYLEHRIPNCGHWVQHEAHEEVTRVIRDFLAG
ncbi:MAG: alpha/beta fold hydrolase [Pyrinomonadaceae bacterium]